MNPRKGSIDSKGKIKVMFTANYVANLQVREAMTLLKCNFEDLNTFQGHFWMNSHIRKKNLLQT